jgi:glycine betaine/proline transport system substrate-binding protein
VALKKEFGIEADAVEIGMLSAFVGLDSCTVDIHPEV